MPMRKIYKLSKLIDIQNDKEPSLYAVFQKYSQL